MRFRNALHISIDNFQNVFKLLLYRIVTGLLFGSLIYVILKLSLTVVLDSAEMHALKDLADDFFRSIVTGDSERLHAFQDDFQEAVKDFLVMLGNNSGSIAGALVGVAIMYLLSRFANGLAVFAVGNTINDRMSTYSRTSFSQAYFKNIGQASLYQLIYVPLCFVFDALMALACWFLFFYVPSFLSGQGFLSILVGLSLTLTAVVCLEALKMTLVSSWMPSMIADKKSVGAGLRCSLTCKKEFGRRFAAFLASVYLIVVVNVVFGIFTFGSALLVTVPLSFVFLLSMQLVNYYNLNGRKYFITFQKIVDAGGEPDNLS